MAYLVLSELGSITSIVGLPLSLLALAIALHQLRQLRGEAQAARDAAEEARRLLRRDLTITDLARLRERIQGLMELHRNGDRMRALDRYPEIWDAFLQIRRLHPDISDEHRQRIQNAIEVITSMQRQVEELDDGTIPPEIRSAFNDALLELQSDLLPDLEDELEKSDSGR